MTRNPKSPLFAVLNLFLVFASVLASPDERRKSYIVYTGEAPSGGRLTSVEKQNTLLTAAIGDERRAREAKIFSYGKSIGGFVAKLLPHEAQKLSNEKGVISVFENARRQLHTTRSWDFLGLDESFITRKANAESDIIVGVLDTGIYVDSPSFSDEGYGPPPARWKGKCVTGRNLTRCNNKVIGAKFFNLEDSFTGDVDGQGSAADYDGHGTHTASTIAGIPIADASLYGIAKGTARGGVPSARIAAYKVCWPEVCTDMDILAAFDEAISDGVDLISVSIGGLMKEFWKDPIAIGSFHAMKKGILTSCSAGNDGPDLFSVDNVAPWILTVAANSIDRQFRTPIKLDDGTTTSGVSMNTFTPKKQMYPLTSGSRASKISENGYGNPSNCDFGTLGEDKVKGRIVYCEGGDRGQDNNIKDLKGAGVIIQTDGPTELALSMLVPGAYVFFKNSNKIHRYINSTKNPRAVIYKTRTFNMSSAPFVAPFSSRGPQSISLNILKPDVSAPGLNILASFSKLTSVTGYRKDNRLSDFNIISGTSMSCPHATAAAAYVKSFHPDWSPAAIKSALMTTATKMKTRGREAELGYGSGQINPTKAVHPGLVYDINLTSYIRFLCKEGYNSTTIALLLGSKTKPQCSDYKPAVGTDGLNYPSMHKQLKRSEINTTAVFHRTVTHVGHGNSVYRAKVITAKGMNVRVVPSVLTFTGPNQRQSFKVVVRTDGIQNRALVISASLEWDDSKHKVRSPIVIFRSV